MGSPMKDPVAVTETGAIDGTLVMTVSVIPVHKCHRIIVQKINNRDNNYQIDFDYRLLKVATIYGKAKI